MPFSRVAEFDVIRLLANGSISATYAKVGSAFDDRVRAFRFVNNTNGDMFFAFTNGTVPASDGTADNFIVPAGSFVLWDIASDSSHFTNNPTFCLSVNTQTWVRQSTAPSSGSVYVECLTAAGE